MVNLLTLSDIFGVEDGFASVKTISGTAYKTITDLAAELEISVGTARSYIEKGTFPPPEKKFMGRIPVAIFSEEYISNARRILNALRGIE